MVDGKFFRREQVTAPIVLRCLGCSFDHKNQVPRGTYSLVTVISSFEPLHRHRPWYVNLGSLSGFYIHTL